MGYLDLAPFGAFASISLSASDPVGALAPFETSVPVGASPMSASWTLAPFEAPRAAREVAIACPKIQCICIADSEADIYELFAEPLETGPQNNLYLLIRACHDRVLTDSDKKLLGTVRSTECLYTRWRMKCLNIPNECAGFILETQPYIASPRKNGKTLLSPSERRHLFSARC